MKTLWGLAESNYIPSFNTFCTRLVVLALCTTIPYECCTCSGRKVIVSRDPAGGNGDNASVASTRAGGPSYSIWGPLGRK